MIYTHDEATRIVECLAEILCQYGIHVPSPEDDEREKGNDVGLYGSAYGEILDEVEGTLISLLFRVKLGEEFESYEYSGNYSKLKKEN